jgi:predicted DNA-binding transcriptional regulator AlpA
LHNSLKETGMANALKLADPLAKASDDEELITGDELADWLKLHPITIHKWRLSGEGPPYFQLGRRAVRYRRGDVRRWLAARAGK